MAPIDHVQFRISQVERSCRILWVPYFDSGIHEEKRLQWWAETIAWDNCPFLPTFSSNDPNSCPTTENYTMFCMSKAWSLSSRSKFEGINAVFSSVASHLFSVVYRQGSFVTLIEISHRKRDNMHIAHIHVRMMVRFRCNWQLALNWGMPSSACAESACSCFPIGGTVAWQTGRREYQSES